MRNSTSQDPAAALCPGPYGGLSGEGLFLLSAVPYAQGPMVVLAGMLCPGPYGGLSGEGLFLLSAVLAGRGCFF